MRSVRICVLSILLLCLSGCSSTSFIGSRFNNFSAYYNTFYNAQRSFKQGVKTIEERLADQPIDRDVFISVFGRNDQLTGQQQPFEDAIAKSADVVREHPNSKWVDDAILIIGKAWFYTLNYVGAEEKFKEILELDSPLKDEANFWLARTLIASGAYEEASTHLQAILSRDNLSTRWEAEYRLTLAELYVQNQNIEPAAMELERAMEQIRGNVRASRAQFLYGQVLEYLERYMDAVEAYDRVQDYKPFYELSFAAQFNAVQVQSEHLDSSEGLRRLRRMERDDKNYEYRAELGYLRGRVLMALGEYDEALAEYDELLYDPQSGGSRVRGRVHYVLGTYYRDVLVDYPYAAAHFDTASSAIKTVGNRSRSSQSMTTTLIPSPSAIIDGDQQAQVFGSFSDVLDQIVLMDSLLYLGTLDDSSFATVVLQLRQQRAEELEKMREEMRQLQSESGFRRNTPGFDDVGFGETAVVAGSEGEAGFLYHKDSQQMMYAREDFVSVWGDRPLAPNWRRIAAIEASLVEEAGVEENSAESNNPTINLPRVDVSAVPRTQQQFDEMLTERANARYELANVLFLSMDMPDSAAVWYRIVIEEDREEEVVKRAYYALAEVQQALGDTLAAHRLYELLISEFPASELTSQAYSRLGRSSTGVVVLDSTAIAEQQYQEHQIQWEMGSSDQIIDHLFHLGLQWHQTPTAPKAFLATTKAYLELASQDSLDVLGQLPVDIHPNELQTAGFYSDLDSTATASDSLLTLPLLLAHIQTSFEDSPQASRAQRILNALTEERDRRQAIQDSLQAAADSLTMQSVAMVDSLVQDSLVIMDSSMVDSLRIADIVQDSLTVTAPLDSLDLLQIDQQISLLNTDMVVDSMTIADTTAFMGFDPLLDQENPELDQPPTLDSLLTDESLSTLSNNESPALTELTDPSMGNLDWSQGGYTIHLISYDNHEMAKAFVSNFSRTLSDVSDPLDIYGAQVQGTIEFRVGLGLFETLQAAELVMQQLQGRLPQDANISRIRAQQDLDK